MAPLMALECLGESRCTLPIPEMSNDAGKSKVDPDSRFYSPGSHENDEVDIVVAKEPEIAWEQGSSWRSTSEYFIMSLLVTVFVNVLLTGIWGGFGTEGASVLRFLQDHAGIMPLPAMLAAAVLLTLYLFDFFWPPHLLGRYCQLWEGDTVVGTGACGLALLCIATSVMLLAKTRPSLPVLTSILLLPLAVACLRVATQPSYLPLRTQGRRPNFAWARWATSAFDCAVGQYGTTPQLLTILRTREDQDVMRFYRAASAAFVCSAIVPLCAWLRSRFQSSSEGEDTWRPPPYSKLERSGDEYLQTENIDSFVLWLAPVLITVADLVFGMYTALPTLLQRVADTRDAPRPQPLGVLPSSPDCENMAPLASDDSSPGGEGSVDSTKRYKRVVVVVRVVGCAFFLLLATVYVTGQLLWADSEMAAAVVGMLLMFFGIFICFIFAVFGQAVRASGRRLRRMPMFQATVAACRSDWARAFVLLPLLPVIPILLALSAANQQVRRCRGLVDPTQRKSGLQGLLTSRVHGLVIHLSRWNWIRVLHRVYVICLLYVIYNMCPVLVNIILAWMRKALRNWNFGWILLATFFIGITAFLLPPVPGVTVYIFGGLVVSNHCPLGGAGTDTAFWIGSAVNIGLCWVMKLAACALQQTCIGGVLGQSLWVRQTVGVHKVAIRCIEAELSAPGWTIGKVAILCGGPDWPTSVLAGVLGLSVMQCELGTLPIIFFIVPCGLSGSLYLRMDKSDIWARAAQTMIITAMLLNLLLWALAAWAMHRRLEREYDRLRKPLASNVDLEWLDYQVAELERRVFVCWGDVPRMVRVVYLLGAFIHMVICHVLMIGYNLLFGDFGVSADIDTLQLRGRDGVFTDSALALIMVYSASILFWIQFQVWLWFRTREPLAANAAELKVMEAEWKERWVRELERSEQILATCPAAEVRLTAAPPPPRAPEQDRGGEHPPEELEPVSFTTYPSDMMPGLSLDTPGSVPPLPNTSGEGAARSPPPQARGAGGAGLLGARTHNVDIADLRTWSEHEVKSPAFSKPTKPWEGKEPLFGVSEVANATLCLWKGCLASLDVDVVAIPTDEALRPEACGGASLVVHTFAGPSLKAECDSVGKPPVRCPVGQTVLTKGHALPARHIVHAPVAADGMTASTLADTYRSALDIARATISGNARPRSVALAPLAGGVIVAEAAAAAMATAESSGSRAVAPSSTDPAMPLTPIMAVGVALETVRSWIDASPDDFDRVVLAVFTEGELEAFERFLPLYFPRRGELDL